MGPTDISIINNSRNAGSLPPGTDSDAVVIDGYMRPQQEQATYESMPDGWTPPGGANSNTPPEPPDPARLAARRAAKR